MRLENLEICTIPVVIMLYTACSVSLWTLKVISNEGSLEASFAPYPIIAFLPAVCCFLMGTWILCRYKLCYRRTPERHNKMGLRYGKGFDYEDWCMYCTWKSIFDDSECLHLTVIVLTCIGLFLVVYFLEMKFMCILTNTQLLILLHSINFIFYSSIFEY